MRTWGIDPMIPSRYPWGQPVFKRFLNDPTDFVAAKDHDFDLG